MRKCYETYELKMKNIQTTSTYKTKKNRGNNS